MLMMASYVWAELCCSKSLQQIKTVICDWPSHPYICMSPSQQEITLKNTAVESSMLMDSRGQRPKPVFPLVLPALKFFLSCFLLRKEPFLFRHIFGLLKHHLLTLAHVACTIHVLITQYVYIPFPSWLAWLEEEGNIFCQDVGTSL